MTDAPITLHQALLDEVPPRALYGQLRVRSAAFVVEQQCIYLDLDGLDLEPGCVLWWHERGGEVLSTIRVLRRGEERVIGRVATAPAARGLGLAGQLIQAAIDAEPGRVFRLGGQKHLAPWYSRFGFERSGDDYMEDDIPHTPMARQPLPATS
ncbi:MAG: GNAT family N-acetyltransferase [Solirubrobacteraceae bacterium]|nr:GNAT family N-acetyltransferase [Solirubrobacteraceae bacterium]